MINRINVTTSKQAQYKAKLSTATATATATVTATQTKLGNTSITFLMQIFYFNL